MKNDFKPVVGHRFNLRADWGGVSTARSWRSSRTGRCPTPGIRTRAAYGLTSVVTWTLTPTGTGTHLRMEQSGFRPDQQQAYRRRQVRLAEVLCKPGAGAGAKAE